MMASESEQIEELRSSLKPNGQGRLDGKIALVTGGSSSIGRAICLAYAREGVRHVVVADLRPTSKDSTQSGIATHDLISKAGGHASFVELDVTNGDRFETVVQDVVKTYERLDVLVNNAGIALNQGSECPIWEASEDTLNATMKVNVNGVFNGTKAGSKFMVNQEPGLSGDRGWIVNLASIYGLVGWPKIAAYVASKHACMGITRSAALDCAPHRVHVNAICPGYVQTSMTERVWSKGQEVADMVNRLHPFKGWGKPEDVAPIAVFLASDDARWVCGTGVQVDGGYTCQ